MKRHIALAIALTLGALTLSLASSGTTAEAAPGNRPRSWMTALLIPGAKEVIRITVVAGPKPISLNFTKIEFNAAECEGEVCRQTAGARTTSSAISLPPGEAFSWGVAQTGSHGAVAYRITADSGAAGVFGERFDAATGAPLGDIHIEALN